jgi:hypothetical protein
MSLGTEGESIDFVQPRFQSAIQMLQRLSRDVGSEGR